MIPAEESKRQFATTLYTSYIVPENPTPCVLWPLAAKAFGVWIVGAYEELIVAGEIHDVLEHPTIALMVGVSLLSDRP